MKTIKSIIFVLFLVVSTTNILAQEQRENNKKIDSLFTIIKKVTPTKRSEIFDRKLLKFKKITINENDLEKAKELMYYAYAHAPLELRKKEKALFEEWKKTDYTELKPNERKKIVEEALIEKYGKDYVGFLKTPYFIRVRINKIINKKNPLPGRMRGSVSRTYLNVKILTILKGKNYYSVNDTITITFMPLWFENSNVSPPRFMTGEEYIIPLNIWKNYSTSIFELDMHGLNTLYQLKNDEVYCPLISSTEVVKSWDEFKKEFEQKYLMDK